MVQPMALNELKIWDPLIIKLRAMKTDFMRVAVGTSRCDKRWNEKIVKIIWMITDVIEKVEKRQLMEYEHIQMMQGSYSKNVNVMTAIRQKKERKTGTRLERR